MKRQIMKFLDVFVHPDREEDPERGEVTHAANLLQIGEFQLLQLAYLKAYGKDLEAALIDQLFAAYMLHGEVPSWALRYAHHIFDLDNRGMLTDQDPTYHRYDSDYYSYVPEGLPKFAVAAGFLLLVIGGAVAIGHFSDYKATSVLPPYFEEGELDQKNKDRSVKLQGS
jgi:hypothetical protein